MLGCQLSGRGHLVTKCPNLFCLDVIPRLLDITAMTAALWYNIPHTCLHLFSGYCPLHIAIKQFLMVKSNKVCYNYFFALKASSLSFKNNADMLRYFITEYMSE